MIKYILIGLLFVFTNTYSQYNQQWVDRLNGSGNSFDIANTILLDEQSNAYVYCTLYDSLSSTDICVVKYSPSGNVLWKYVYPSPGIDQMQDIYKDAQNFSYITGYTADSGRIKLLTFKLTPTGDTVWTKVTTIPNHETLISHSIISDKSNNIFVLFDGRNVATSRTDFMIIKYNQSGVILQQKIFEGSPGGDDNGIKLVCDAQGNIFVGVNSQNTGTAYDIVLYKFDNDLNQIYTKTINGTANSDDGVIDMKIASDNNIILTGKIFNSGTQQDIGTYKINNSNGDIIWSKIYNGIGNDIDLPYALTIDNENNILVTGYARNSNQIESEDIITLKYNSAGNLLWSKIYNDSTNGTDEGFSICTDSQNNVYVGGMADHGNRRVGYITLKYDALGNLLWKGTYNYIALSEDFIYKIAVNNSQDIFITGISFSNTTDYDVTTIKYARQTGINNNYETVKDFKLYPNYPNPFNPSTIIRFYNPNKEYTSIKIYDISGKEITELENSVLNSGEHRYIFNAGDLSAGTYFYKIFHGNSEEFGKVVYVK
ncbi:MAG: T9SS type A sorting domain-containing protein [Bacteroidetes bacterium]|nr:T9SS type A sorting domain-containing protein [Bacteroidota bacterium]